MEIQHPSHDHPLLLIETDKCPNSKFECRGCRRPYHEFGPIYGCGECNFYLHKSCAEFPPQIQSPLHPPHQMTLHYSYYISLNCRSTCSCCRNDCERFSYYCDECDYRLDLECASLNPLLKLRDPDHLLCLLEVKKVDFVYYAQCSICKEDLSGVDATSPVFVCLVPKCSRALHFHCSPLSLPEIAPRHYFHNYHDLIYIGEPAVKLEGPRFYSGDERYCDVCEEPRNPKFPIYYCKECEYSSHVYCAVSEVLPSLVEKYEKDFIERNVCLDAFLNYFDREVSEWRSRAESSEAGLDADRRKLEALQAQLARYNSLE